MTTLYVIFANDVPLEAWQSAVRAKLQVEELRRLEAAERKRDEHHAYLYYRIEEVPLVEEEREDAGEEAARPEPDSGPALHHWENVGTEDARKVHMIVRLDPSARGGLDDPDGRTACGQVIDPTRPGVVAGGRVGLGYVGEKLTCGSCRHDMLNYAAARPGCEASPPDEDRVHDEADPRPDFAGFAEALRDEAAWVAQIHRNDTSDNGVGDQRALNRLADEVERVGRNLGFM